MQPMLIQPMMLAMAILMATSLAVSAQTTTPSPSPPPGPTNPTPNPQAQPGATIVINPTQDECQRGWNASMRWTQDQFREFCAKLGASK
jgi:hypothetical protein